MVGEAGPGAHQLPRGLEQTVELLQKFQTACAMGERVDIFVARRIFVAVEMGLERAVRFGDQRGFRRVALQPALWIIALERPAHDRQTFVDHLSIG